MNNRVALNIAGYGSVFLGNLSDAECRALQSELEALGVDILRDDGDESFEPYLEAPTYSTYAYAYANPSARQNADDSTIAERSLKGVYTATIPKNNLYPTRCTVGRQVHNDHLFPIQRTYLEKVSLDEAVASLMFFFPTLTDTLSEETRTKMQTQRFLSDADISKFSASDKSLFTKAKVKLTTTMLSGNAKLKKSKVPRILGLELKGQAPSRSDFVETDVPGSVGLSLLPNYSLTNPDTLETGERSFLTIIKDPSTKVYTYASEMKFVDLKSKKPTTSELEEFHATRVANFDFFKTLTLETLAPFTTQTCCAFASKGCKTICLYATGGRYYTICDVLKQQAKTPSTQLKLESEEASLEDELVETVNEAVDPISKLRRAEGGDRIEKDANYNRMITGCWHTAFLANPIYYIRILIENIKLHIESHKSQLCFLNQKLETPLNADNLYKKLPPSVRLNVYSDYVWETICPDLFDIFDGKRSFAGQRMSFVQFYDYTKIPGRWSQSIRQDVANAFGIKDPTPSYKLPKNYHITFSFSGSKASYEQSIFASKYAKQNSTFVFFSTDLNSSIFERIKEDAKRLTDNQKLQSTVTFLNKAQSIQKAITKFMKTRAVQGGLEKTMGLIPRTHEGFRVIDGDAYDLRFLDIDLAEQLRVDSLIVGLKYKEPTNLKIDIGGGYTVNPLTASLFGMFESTSDFVQLRLGLGFEAIDDAKSSFTLVITPNELGSTSITDTLVTFANENAQVFDTDDSLESIVSRLNQSLNEIATLSSVEATK